MKLTLSWLQKYLPELDASDLNAFRYRLDTRLTEIEDIQIKGEGIESISVARVVECNPHPQSTKLSVCTVDIGEQEQVTVVCGAPNVRAGMYTAYCAVGGTVKNPDTDEVLKIASRAIAGVESHGMLCSAAELGLSGNHDGIIELPTNTLVGMPIVQAIKDIVIEIQNKAIPHRPDCFSHLGIARELSAVFKTNLVIPELDQSKLNEVLDTDHQLPLQVEINSKTCQRFTAVALNNIKVGPSPLWLQIQLIYCGIRPINNVVDITNYVMLDMGQPLHAFDYDKIAGGKLTVRETKAGEKLTTLDGKERELPAGITVVADKSGVQSVAGIMGGAASEISNETTKLILEAASWERYTIRGSSRTLGLRTEASTRFEKGPSPAVVLDGLQQAITMLQDLCGAERASEIIDINPEAQEQRVVEFDSSSVKRLIGIELGKDELVAILEAIGIVVQNKSKIASEAINRDEISAIMELAIPAHRMDLNIDADILEEVARMYGYERIPKTLPERTISPVKANKTLTSIRNMKTIASHKGFFEIYSYVMVGPEMYRAAMLDYSNCILIKNPISTELSMVRDQLVPSLLSKVSMNMVDGYEEFGLFELDQVVNKAEVGDDKLPKPGHAFAAIYVSDQEELALSRIHNLVDAIEHELQIPLTFKAEALRAEDKYLHPGKALSIYFGKQRVGVMGIAQAKINENFNVGNKYIGVINIDKLDELFALSGAHGVIPYSPIADVPTVIRDISMWENQPVQLSEVRLFILELKIPQLHRVEVLDSFVNQDGKRSVTLRVYLNGGDHTLTNEEVSKHIAEIAAKLQSKFGLTLR